MNGNRFTERWLPAFGAERIEVDGVCTVQPRDGLIDRNTVWFDRSELVAAWARAR